MYDSNLKPTQCTKKIFLNILCYPYTRVGHSGTSIEWEPYQLPWCGERQLNELISSPSLFYGANNIGAPATIGLCGIVQTDDDVYPNREGFTFKTNKRSFKEPLSLKFTIQWVAIGWKDVYRWYSNEPCWAISCFERVIFNKIQPLWMSDRHLTYMLDCSLPR